MSCFPNAQAFESVSDLYKSNYHLLPEEDQYSTSVYAATLISSQYPNVPKRNIELLRQQDGSKSQQPQQANSSKTQFDSNSLESSLAATKHQAPSTDKIEARAANQFYGSNQSQPVLDSMSDGPQPSDQIPKYRLTRIIKAHDNWVTSVQVDIANKLFATGSNDQTVKIWDLAKGTQLYTFTGHLLPVNCVRFSPHHPRLFSCSNDREVKMWDLETNQFVTNFHGHKKAVTTLELHPTLDLVITGSADRTLRVWDLRTKNAVRVLEGHRETITTLVTLPTDPQVISGSFDASIRLWDIGSGKTYSTHVHHSKSIRKLITHPRDYSLLSASSDAIKQWRLPIVSTVQHEGEDHWTNVTQRALFDANPQLAHRNINPITGVQAALKPYQETVTTPQMTLMGTYTGSLAPMLGANAQQPQQQQQQQQQTTSPGKPIVHGMALNNQDVLVAGRADGVVDCYDYHTGQCYDSIVTPPIQGSLSGEAAICDMAFDSTGTAFLTACADKTIKMYVMK